MQSNDTLSEEDSAMYNHQLDTFIQVADAGSFSKAAEALYISSTAVMKRSICWKTGWGCSFFTALPAA